MCAPEKFAKFAAECKNDQNHRQKVAKKTQNLSQFLKSRQKDSNSVQMFGLRARKIVALSFGSMLRQ
jgi:hypothetical protein